MPVMILKEYICLIKVLMTDTAQAKVRPDRVQHQCTPSMYIQQIIPAMAQYVLFCLLHVLSSNSALLQWLDVM